MEKVKRPSLESVPSLKAIEDKLKEYCIECENGLRKWSSSDINYNILKTELKIISKGHCSFCDGYPLKDTSRETIEHYYPQAEFKNLTYSWDNLFLCCDACQSFANSDRPFKKTLKMDEDEYFFEKYFWFDPQDGEVKILENLLNDDLNNATNFLRRYGINKSPERLQSRKTRYNDLIIILKDNVYDRDIQMYRFVFDLALKTTPLIKLNQ
jgi:uncharacterized protein (TIGR02646 family)